ALPQATVVEMVLVPLLPPWMIVTEPGLGAGLKAQSVVGVLTGSDAEVDCVADPSVPVIVTVKVPVAEPQAALRVSVELFPAVTLVVFKLAVTPAGLPPFPTRRSSDLALPQATVVEMVLVPLLPPWVIVTEPGLGAGL